MVKNKTTGRAALIFIQSFLYEPKRVALLLDNFILPIITSSNDKELTIFVNGGTHYRVKELFKNFEAHLDNLLEQLNKIERGVSGFFVIFMPSMQK